jgi:hypothetical protein
MQDLLLKIPWLEPLYWIGLATPSPSTSLLLNRYCTVSYQDLVVGSGTFEWSVPEKLQSNMDHKGNRFFFIRFNLCSSLNFTLKDVKFGVACIILP